MFGNNNWTKREIPSEVMIKSMEKVKGYYYRRLNTMHDNYAHIFVCEMKDEKDLVENWNNIVNLIAVYVQSEVENLLQRSNFYIWFFCSGEITPTLRKKIEDDTYSSKKYVVEEEVLKSEKERIEIVEKRLFSYGFAKQNVSGKMIQKVVMKNFRTFKGERVFDFSNGEKPARLIVLFAPNGMGKTSFFDGIEWVFTETVDRFGKLGNKSVDGSILKNTEANEAGEEAVVTIYTEKGEWVKRKVSGLNNKTKKDTGKGIFSCSKVCSLKPVIGNNGIWANLLLQHHKIDGFIAAANPQQLYKEWCSLWDPTGEERSHFEISYKEVKTRKKTLEDATKKYNELSVEHDKVKKKRDFVEKLADDIEKFNRLAYGDELALPDFSFITPGEYLKWSNGIDQRIDAYGVRNDRIEQELLYAVTSLETDVNNYKSLVEKKKAFDSKLLEAKDKIERYQKKKEILALEADSEKQKASLEKALEGLYLIGSNSNQYEEIRTYFEVFPRQPILQNLIEEAQDKLSSSRRQQEVISVDLHNKKIAVEEKKEYKILSEHLDNIQQLEIEKIELEKSIAVAQNQMAETKGKISEYVLRQEELRKKFFQSFEELFERFRTSNLQCKEEVVPLESIRVFLAEEFHKYSEIDQEIRRIDQSILNEENMGIQLQQILEKVRNLIEQQQMKTCPVCHTSFGDSDILMQSTYYTNSAEGEKLKRRREEEKRKLDEKKELIEGYRIQYNLQLEALIAEIEMIIINERELLESTQKSCNELQILLGNKEAAISQISEMDQRNGIYVVYSKEGIDSWYDSWSKRQRAEIQVLEKQFEELAVKIAYEQGQIAELEETLKKNEAIILNVESFFKEYFDVIQNLKDYITKYSYEELRNQIYEMERKKEILSDELIKYKADLTAYQDISESLQEVYAEQKESIQADIRNIMEEENIIAERIKKSVFMPMENEELETAISSDWKEQVKQKEEQLRNEKDSIMKALGILNQMKYNREIENYFQKNKEMAQQIEESGKEKKQREEELKKAEREYKNSRDKIEKNLKQFFNEFQISDLYEKLEPHDTLRTLTCEFGFNEDDKPELTFKVIGKDDKPYAPEWYLSTAQLNVVAFSVFLGRALQTMETPLESIFIDDPVGHFDEMNVVCFVDLLRNIVENTEKQLIISTHEERVFGLIQRKLPKDEYPVCYIDFRKDF